MTTGEPKAVSPQDSSKKVSPLAACLTFAAIIAVYFLTWAQAIGKPFVDDDWLYLNVVQQPGWWHSSSILNPRNGLYRPVLFYWFGLLHTVAGLHPVVYHLATASVAFLVGILTWRVGVAVGLKRGALIAGALVLSSAVVGYSTSWTSAASSPIAVAFGLGAILVLINRPSTFSRSFMSAVLLLLGLLTREVVIVVPAIFVVIGCARPGGTLSDALRRSLPLWIVDIGYLAFRTAAGARNPTGPYHMGINSHGLNNLASLIMRAGDLPVDQLRGTSIPALVLFTLIGAALYWTLLRRSSIVIAGLIWFGIGLLPVVLLVNHAPDPYYIDLALPGFAIAVGAAFEQLVAGRANMLAIAVAMALVFALGFVGRSYSDAQFAQEFGPDIASTHRLLAEVDAAYPVHPSGTELIVVRSQHVARDESLVSGRGDLFRVVYHDPFLRVRIVP